MEHSAASPGTATDNRISDNQFRDGTKIHQGNKIKATLNINLTDQPARSAIRAIPYPRNEDIIDRPDIVDSLNRLLPYPSATSHSAALWGLGGSGKTQIALNYAYQRCADASCSVLWVHADTEATFSQDYKTIARKLQIDKSHLSEEDLFEAVRDGIEALSNWVLILDNADDLTLFGVGQTDQETKALFQYIPHASTGTVLWTTRDAHITGTLVSQGRGIEVARMTSEEATQLLMTFRSTESSREAEIDSLVKELQCLPLAIIQAGVYMYRASITTKEYLALLAQSKKRWNILRVNEFSRHRRPHALNNVLETWTISITRIKQESKSAYEILHIIAYVSNENIPHEIITTALSYINDTLDSELLESEATKIITRLKEYSFIGIRQVGDGSINYEMHKLVQEAIRYGLSIDKSSHCSENDIVQSNVSQKGGERETSQHEIFAQSKLVELMTTSDDKDMTNEKYFSGIALNTINDLFSISETDSWKQREKYLAHALQIGDWADISGKHTETTNLLIKAVVFLHDLGRLKEVERVSKRLLELQQKVLGDEHPSTIWAIAYLAVGYYHQGRYSEAEALEVHVLDMRQKMLGDRHLDTVAAMKRLGLTYHKQGRYSEAETLQVQVLNTLRESLGDKHPNTIDAIANLTKTYNEQGRYAQAESLRAQVFGAIREGLEDRRLATFRSIEDLVVAHHGQGRYNEAESLQVQVVNSVRETLGNKHPETLRAMENLATIYHRQGRYNEAETLQVQVVDSLRETLGDKYLNTITAMANLAAIYHRQGRCSEAETLEVQVLNTLRENYGDRHPSTIVAMQSLAWIWYDIGRYQDAVEMMQQALQYSDSTLGTNHTPTAVSVLSILSILADVEQVLNLFSLQRKRKE